MNTLLSSHSITHLVLSLPPVESRRDSIAEALAAGLAGGEPSSELSPSPRFVAILLLDFVIDQVRHVVEGGAPRNLALHHAEHRRHDIAGRHYSRFGDALVPVLRDSLGPTYARETASAWGDAFWALVQRMQQDDEGTDGAAKPSPAAQLVD